jgi:hypothetical protein
MAINTNEFIGLTRAWGALPGDGSGQVDCCALAAELHKRLGYCDYGPELQEIFSQYDDHSLPSSFIAKWLLKNGKRLKKPEPHAVVLLPSEGVGALGTVLEDGTVLFIGPGGRVVRTALSLIDGWFFRLNK